MTNPEHHGRPRRAGVLPGEANIGTYKIVGVFTTPEKVERVKLESFGDNPLSFWVDKEKLCDAPPPVRKPGETVQRCWECGGEFTWRECQHDGGDWGESYCGC